MEMVNLIFSVFFKVCGAIVILKSSYFVAKGAACKSDHVDNIHTGMLLVIFGFVLN